MPTAMSHSTGPTITTLPYYFTGSFTAPQISRVQTCASVSIIGNSLGSASAYASSKASVVKVASSACGNAIVYGLGDLCTGADPIATIFSMSQTCSAALAEMYTKSLTNAQVIPADLSLLLQNYTTDQYILACGSACSNAQGAAEAFAQAAACGAASATHGCTAVTNAIKTRSFTRAFVRSTANSWSTACAKGYGAAFSGGETIALTAAASISKAMAQIAATACASCDTCNCKPLPAGFAWEDATDYSETTATITKGRSILAKSMAQATTTFCLSDGKPKSVSLATNTILNAAADLMIVALGRISGLSVTVGNAWACGGGSLQSQITVSMLRHSQPCYCNAMDIEGSA